MSTFDFESVSTTPRLNSKANVSKAVSLVRDPVEDSIQLKNPFLVKAEFNDVKKLPSLGLAYPSGAEISYRSYTLGEIDQLENSSLSVIQMYELILRGIETSFPKNDLTLSDTMYLGLLRRLLSMGTSSVMVSSVCPKCSQSNSTKVETELTAFEDLSVPKLPINVQLTKGVLKFSPITIGKYFKLIESGIKMDTVSIMAIQCTNFEFPESVEVISNLSNVNDIKLIKKVDKLLYHGISPISVTCSQHVTVESEDEVDEKGDPKSVDSICGHVYTVQLENASEAFIYPFRGEEGDTSVEISFG